jgi:nicotinamide mononucleotide transporter
MTDPIEVLANALVTVSILLAARNSVHTWWTGIVGCALFAATFYRVALYADVALQVFFIATSLIGWWQWLRGGTGEALPLSRATPRQLAGAIAVAAIATAGYGALLARFTDAFAPFVDSAILAASVVAQVFLMKRQVENWPVWLLVNSIAVPLYANRGLQLTATLYAGYWVNAWFGWWRWHRLHQIQRAGA